MRWVCILLLFAGIAHADTGVPTDWIRRWNDLPINEDAEKFESVAELMEQNDYLRLHEVGLAQVYDKKSSPWRPLQIERSAVYAFILAKRIGDYEYARRRHELNIDHYREDIGIAYRRLARCEGLRLWHKMLLLRGQEVAEADWNIDIPSPVPHGGNYIWKFAWSGSSRAVFFDAHVQQLYEALTDFRETNPIMQMLSLFTLRIWFVTSGESDIRLGILKHRQSLEIEDASGNNLDLSAFNKLAVGDDERIIKEWHELSPR